MEARRKSYCGARAVPNLSALRALAFAVSSSRFFGGAVVSSPRRRRFAMPAISSMAAWNAASLALEGLLKPVIFLTNWSDAARTSSSVTGGSKLKSVLIFLHMIGPQKFCRPADRTANAARRVAELYYRICRPLEATCSRASSSIPGSIFGRELAPVAVRKHLQCGLLKENWQKRI